MAMYVNLIPFGVQTSSAASKTVTIYDKYTAAHIVVDHPNVGGGLTITVFGKDQTSGYSYPLLSSAVVTSGHTVMKIGPELTAGANIAKDYIPYQFYVSVTTSGTNAFGVSASVM